MEITVRVASPSDLTCLHRLQVRASLANAGDRDYLLTNLDVIQVNRQILESGRTFVAQCELKRGDCQVLGFAELEAPVASEVELEGIFVEPSWWRRGVGAALARHCQCFARQ
ncbi:MAG TPA: GNAT family N-acetyltransferase, partial [Pirellulaceae bacterium]|nr:GNAT family N-acetyltransferase [Pirellulaceae bacterium]